MFLHIDCNAYFASCEVATRPELIGRPVVVASDDENGGGIVLALTAEAKALGIKRGIPLFQVRNLIKVNKVTVCPADHEKYRRISRQIMDAVQHQQIVLGFVQYSVDEFFGTLPSDDPDELRHYASAVKEMIFATTGIPVSCGLSQSYTLAKVATHYAKHYNGYGGICVLMPEKRERALSLLDVADIWGIGRRLRASLYADGIRTALQFAELDEQDIRNRFALPAQHTWHELHGIPCIDLQRPSKQRSISQSRTFAYMIDNYNALDQQMRTFVASCAAKLRQQGSVCRTVQVFLATNRHRKDLPQYCNGISINLTTPSADTPTLVTAALSGLHQVYKEGYLYKQAGVALTNISDEEGMQLDLFTAPDDERHRKLMRVADAINQKFGNNTVGFGISAE